MPAGDQFFTSCYWWMGVWQVTCHVELTNRKQCSSQELQGHCFRSKSEQAVCTEFLGHDVYMVISVPSVAINILSDVSRLLKNLFTRIHHLCTKQQCSPWMKHTLLLYWMLHQRQTCCLMKVNILFCAFWCILTNLCYHCVLFFIHSINTR